MRAALCHSPTARSLMGTWQLQPDGTVEPLPARTPTRLDECRGGELIEPAAPRRKTRRQVRAVGDVVMAPKGDGWVWLTWEEYAAALGRMWHKRAAARGSQL